MVLLMMLGGMTLSTAKALESLMNAEIPLLVANLRTSGGRKRPVSALIKQRDDLFDDLMMPNFTLRPPPFRSTEDDDDTSSMLPPPPPPLPNYQQQEEEEEDSFPRGIGRGKRPVKPPYVYEGSILTSDEDEDDDGRDTFGREVDEDEEDSRSMSSSSLEEEEEDEEVVEEVQGPLGKRNGAKKVGRGARGRGGGGGTVGVPSLIVKRQPPKDWCYRGKVRERQVIATGQYHPVVRGGGGVHD